MANPQNLKPWKPGQSGNPGGQPTKKPITELYEQLSSDGATIEAIRAAILRSINGSNTVLVSPLREMADRTEGKMTQPIEAKVTELEHLTDQELQDRIERITEELRAAERMGTEN